MKGRFLLLVLTMTTLAAITMWAQSSIAGTPTDATNPGLSAVQQEQHGCGSESEAGTQLIEACVISYCSNTPGYRCDWVSGSSCNNGKCHYHRVPGTCDPSVAPPSCAVGCN